MRLVRSLGVVQAVLPPHERPRLSALRQRGYTGSDEEVLAAVARADPLLLRQCSSASAMWTANAATVAPSCDTRDKKVHLVPANLEHLFHRSIEADVTTRVLRTIFRDPERFVVHDPAPTGKGFSDEGAANHLRLATSRRAFHVFAWGKIATPPHGGPAPRRFPARQTMEGSAWVRAMLPLEPLYTDSPQQDPDGIDAGAFHTDVVAVSNESFLMLHELAFVRQGLLLDELRTRLGEELVIVQASNDELPIDRAVASYLFNSQVLTLPDASMAIIAPEDACLDDASRSFLERAAAAAGRPTSIHYVDVRQSMHNGGGPACLRLRVLLTDAEVRALSGHVIVDDALDAALVGWVERHYRDRLVPADLGDPLLAREGMRALDELTALLGLGAVYDFQRAC
jgi:succinylarginine dihydrolase